MDKGKKKKIILGVGIAFGIFLALVGFRLHDNSVKAQMLKNMPKQTTPVSIQLPKSGRIADVFATTGTIVSPDEVQVITKASGRIMSLSVDEGSYVYAGQVLGTLDHAEIDAQLAQAQAQTYTAKANLDLQVNGPLADQIKQARAGLRQAEANLRQIKVNARNIEADYARYKKMAENKVISEQQLETSKTQAQATREQVKAAQQQVISARSALKILTDGTRIEQIKAAHGQFAQANASINFVKAQLANYYITSPINGVVSKRYLSIGSMASPSSPVFTIVQNGRLELNMNIPEREISNIRIGQPVELITPANPDKVITTYIREISPVVDSQTRLLKVKAPVSAKLLKAGMLVDCSVVFAQKIKTMILPAEAVIIEENKPVVYIASKNKVYVKPITIGLRTPTEVEILSGLKIDDQVIVKGNAFVKSGDSIKVEEENGEQ